jgi:hypothetical protein
MNAGRKSGGSTERPGAMSDKRALLICGFT